MRRIELCGNRIRPARPLAASFTSASAALAAAAGCDNYAELMPQAQMAFSQQLTADRGGVAGGAGGRRRELDNPLELALEMAPATTTRLGAADAAGAHAALVRALEGGRG